MSFERIKRVLMKSAEVFHKFSVSDYLCWPNTEDLAKRTVIQSLPRIGQSVLFVHSNLFFMHLLLRNREIIFSQNT